VCCSVCYRADRLVSRAIDRAHTAHVSCVYPVLMSLCEVRAWGGGRERHKVKQRTNVKEREREIEREVHTCIHIYMVK